MQRDRVKQELNGNSILFAAPILDTWSESWPVDVAMTREQERAVWEKLCQPSTPSEINIPLDDWVESVKSICPIALNLQALEANDLRADTEITTEDDASSTLGTGFTLDRRTAPIPTSVRNTSAERF